MLLTLTCAAGPTWLTEETSCSLQLLLLHFLHSLLPLSFSPCPLPVTSSLTPQTPPFPFSPITGCLQFYLMNSFNLGSKVYPTEAGIHKDHLGATRSWGEYKTRPTPYSLFSRLVNIKHLMATQQESTNDSKHCEPWRGHHPGTVQKLRRHTLKLTISNEGIRFGWEPGILGPFLTMWQNNLRNAGDGKDYFLISLSLQPSTSVKACITHTFRHLDITVLQWALNNCLRTTITQHEVSREKHSHPLQETELLRRRHVSKSHHTGTAIPGTEKTRKTSNNRMRPQIFKWQMTGELVQYTGGDWLLLTSH